MALIKAKVRMGIGSDAEQSLSSYPLVGRVVPPEGITFSWIQDEMEALNRRALRKEFEVSAMSVMTFLQVANHYAVMPCALTSGD
ncbi:MAG: MqnA/MqnD/SBP family protein, partial [Candidatus Omnitrophota bacterium]